ESTNTSFFVMYDGRGIPEPIAYFYDYRSNFHRWETVYRGDRIVNGSNYGNRFKGKMHTAPEDAPLTDGKAIVPIVNNDVTDNYWSLEPNGIRKTWDSNRWYTIRSEWNNDTKDFRIYRDGEEVWHNKKNIEEPYEGDEHFSSTSPYPWLPVDFKIWLGSGPSDNYSSKMPNMVFRNFKVVQVGGSQDSLSLSETELNVDFSSGNADFQIFSNTDWDINITDPWISASQQTGNGDTTVVLTYQENDSFDPRVALIEISTEYILDTIQITQEGKPLQYISVTQDTFNVDFPSGELDLSVEANVNWYISYDQEWISVSRQDTLINDTLKIIYDQNNSSNQRIAEITLTNDTVNTVISVIQGGSDIYINIPKRTWEVSKNSGNVTFFVESNQNWSLVPNVNWLTPSYQDSSGDASFMVHYGVNTDTSSRTGHVLIVGEYITDSVGVIQAGAEPVEVIIQVDPAEAGTINGGGIYGYGSSANLEAVANEGWQFDNWTENDSVISSDTVYSFQVKTERTLTANFSIATGVEDLYSIPVDFNLSQNYPNPFNPSTVISFGLPEVAYVSLNIYNLLGQEVKKVISKELNSGYYNINFDASDLPSGTYIYSIKANGINGKEFVQSKKMLLLK
ncbi:MAG: BACON domain-containing carbohydrate-binding protein, partial [Melioribacteraceae bacterium]|nr:BACON domain-containing carbohydrate-binding protein [Melioribacteraceae bacterium]